LKLWESGWCGIGLVNVQFDMKLATSVTAEREYKRVATKLSIRSNNLSFKV